MSPNVDQPNVDQIIDTAPAASSRASAGVLHAATPTMLVRACAVTLPLVAMVL